MRSSAAGRSKSTGFGSLPNTTMPPRGGIELNTTGQAPLDADAKFAGLVRAGIGIEVVRRALLEAVAVAQLAAHVDAQRGHGDAHGKPGNKTQCVSPLSAAGRIPQQAVRVRRTLSAASCASMIAQFWFGMPVTEVRKTRSLFTVWFQFGRATGPSPAREENWHGWSWPPAGEAPRG